MATKVITGICTAGGAFLGGVLGYMTWGGILADNVFRHSIALSENLDYHRRAPDNPTALVVTGVAIGATSGTLVGERSLAAQKKL
ncbi:MAG: hypothetical protein JW769_05495 [Parachlamydiales bacterium]|nr:hypothetical protein [Parachlamydiales bacterium]